MNVADLITELQKHHEWFDVCVMAKEETIVYGYAFNTVTRIIGHINDPEKINLFVEPVD